MKRVTSISILCLAVLLIAGGCKRRGPLITRTDTETSGHAVIAADESFAPVVNEQLAVFTGLNPEAQIDPLFVSEPELFGLLMSDSVRLVIAAKNITRAQTDSLKRMKLMPRSQKLASDGIALIINKSNPDSLISVDNVRKIMTGEITDWGEVNPLGRSRLGNIQVVFDKPNSSTLRFVVDSITRDKALSPALRALENNPAVIDYVSKTPNAMGVIGVNWISNLNDTTQMKFDESINVMAVGRAEDVNIDNTYKPYPAFLNNGNYPFTRDVYIIITDSWGTLPSGFVKFSAGDAGQRIILKAGLVPGTRPTREIMMTTE